METKSDLTIQKRIFRPNFFISEQFTQNIRFIINHRTVARSAMLEQIRRYFSLYQTHLTAVNIFAGTYEPKHAARWYTKDSFLHRVINEVLCTGNFESYNLLRFYIADLSEQLYHLKCQQQRNVTQTKENTILYRGLRQSAAQLKTLQSLVGQIIMTKRFMSTTGDKSTALFYAAPSHPQSLKSQSLLIEISVDMAVLDIIVADIAHLSQFPDEKEVLFDIGVKFRVESLEYDTSHSMWHCQLVAVSSESQMIPLAQQILSHDSYMDPNSYSEDEAKLERIMSRDRRRRFFPAPDNKEDELLWSNSATVPWIAITSQDRARMAYQRALINWYVSSDIVRFHSECKQAWELFKSDSGNEFIDSHDTASFLNNLGFTYLRLKMTDNAIKLLRRASKIRNRIGASAHFQAQSLRNLAVAYTDKGEYDHAFALLNQALRIGQQSMATSQWSTSMTLSNFVYFYHAKGDYRQAIEYYFRALETFEQCLKLNNKFYEK